MNDIKIFVIENGKVIFKNFSGVKTNYNPKGIRSFGIVIDDKNAEVLKQDGWNIREVVNQKDKKKEQYLKVLINYNYFNKPKVIVNTANGKRVLKKNEIDILDKIELKNTRLIIRSYCPKNLENENKIIAYLSSFDINDLYLCDTINNMLKKEENSSVEINIVNEEEVNND